MRSPRLAGAVHATTAYPSPVSCTFGTVGASGRPRTVRRMRPSVSRAGSSVTSRTRNRTTISPMKPSAGRTDTWEPVDRAVPEPGVSTCVPTTRSAESGNGL